MVNWSNRMIVLKEKFSKKMILYSLIVFALSFIIYETTTVMSWQALSGLFMILSGAIALLFLFVFLILELIWNMAKNKEDLLNKIKENQQILEEKKIVNKRQQLRNNSSKKKVVSSKKVSSKKISTKKKVVPKRKVAIKKKTVTKKKK